MMAVTCEQIVDEALTWVGTPFRSNQRAKGIGVDCIGLVAGVYEACGIDVGYRNDYSMRPDGTLRDALAQRLDVVRGPMRPGDVILMAFYNALPHHIALYIGDDEIIHAYVQARRVTRQPYDAHWRDATRGVFRHYDLI